MDGMNESRLRRALLALAAVFPLAASAATAAGSHPDFSGVWAREEGFEHPDPKKILPFLKPEAAADFSQHILKHDYRVPWSFCDPPAMPAMLTEYPGGLEFLFTKDRATMTAEDGSVRRIYMDGRAHPKDPDPTYFGDSIAHWEGDTLIIDTVGLRADNDVVMGFPAADYDMHVVERWHRVTGKPNLLQLDEEITGVGALKEPFKRTQRYLRRADGTMHEQLCVSSQNRDTGSSFNLTPPPPQTRSE